MQNRFPGTIGITNELLAAILERITEQAFLNGFRNVILMGDHAGGQPEVYEEVANKLNARYGALRVFYCDQVYRPANDAFDQYLAQHGYPPGLHGYLFDTSEMMYLDKGQHMGAQRSGLLCSGRSRRRWQGADRPAESV
jgi:creatinine amidohydrolase